MKILKNFFIIVVVLFLYFYFLKSVNTALIIEDNFTVSLINSYK